MIINKLFQGNLEEIERKLCSDFEKKKKINGEVLKKFWKILKKS